VRTFILAHKTMHSIHTGIITLTGKTSDYGESVRVTNPELISVTECYEYWKTSEGVFRRSINYWIGSPYGFSRVLPCPCDKWGLSL
jgi:hypothetical protein